MNFHYNSWADYNITSSVYTSGTWHHIAIVRENPTTIKLYRNGVLEDTETVPSGLVVNNTRTEGLRIGAQIQVPLTYDYNGYLDEVRISKGVARWTSNFLVY